MNKEINLLRTVLCVTQRCTLKCKLCLAFIPYYKNPVDIKPEEAEAVLKEYFDLIHSVNVFTVTGGEPLMHRDLASILELVYRYLPQIRKSVDFVTNSTLDIPEHILEIFERNRSHTRIVLSDYGSSLSTKIKQIEEKLKERNISYRISNFHGNDLYFDGWIDFTDHSKKIFSLEERDKHSQECIHSTGKYFLINEGELHSCSRSYWRMREGFIPRNEKEYVPLLDTRMSKELKQEILLHMLNQKSSSSCAHCVGLKNGVPRHYPAEQL